jgi:ribosomal protein S4
MADRNTPVQPFSKPWRLVEHAESFEVQDSAERTLAFVYFEDEPTRRGFMRRLSKYDARRMAEQILRLPELVAIERKARNQA